MAKIEYEGVKLSASGAEWKQGLVVLTGLFVMKKVADIEVETKEHTNEIEATAGDTIAIEEGEV